MSRSRQSCSSGSSLSVTVLMVPLESENTIQLGDVRTGVLVAVTESEQGYDFTSQFVSKVGLVLLNDLGLEGTGPVSRCVQLKATSRSFHGLATGTVLAVGRVLRG